jgi:pyridoxal phosphate enzyme (YggS family)
LSTIAERYREVQNQIRDALKASGRSDSVTLVAVSKVQPIEAIRSLYDLGQRDFGENYVQELVEKAETLSKSGVNDIRWHFIGHLQSNKVKQLLPHVATIQSIDSFKLAQEISKRWKATNASSVLSIFLSVNIDQEESKSGVSVSETREIARQVSELEGIRLEGLMCIPAPGNSRTAFARLKELELACRPYTHGALSMGMSDDFSDAIAAGATLIRVGTSLFGKRS